MKYRVLVMRARCQLGARHHANVWQSEADWPSDFTRQQQSSDRNWAGPYYPLGTIGTVPRAYAGMEGK
jgi:hypothetical protein